MGYHRGGVPLDTPIVVSIIEIQASLICMTARALMLDAFLKCKHRTALGVINECTITCSDAG